MFIELTDADNGQVCSVEAGAVQGVCIFDKTHTQVLLLGGASIIVREARERVVDLVEQARRVGAGRAW